MCGRIGRNLNQLNIRNKYFISKVITWFCIFGLVYALCIHNLIAISGYEKLVNITAVLIWWGVLAKFQIRCYELDKNEFSHKIYMGHYAIIGFSLGLLIFSFL